MLSCCDERSVRDYLIVITGADYSRVQQGPGVCRTVIFVLGPLLLLLNNGGALQKCVI